MLCIRPIDKLVDCLSRDPLKSSIPMNHYSDKLLALQKMVASDPQRLMTSLYFEIEKPKLFQADWFRFEFNLI